MAGKHFMTHSGAVMAAPHEGASFVSADPVVTPGFLSRPDDLLRMSGGEIHALFDAPELVRADHPIVVHQYRSASCVLDIYFASMEDTVSQAPAVHYEIRARSSDVPEFDQKECLQSLEPRG